MWDHTIKLSHFLLSQENIFSFCTELWHFQSHIVPKNVKFSKLGNDFIFSEVTTLKSPFLNYIGLETLILHIYENILDTKS